jgi:hypothetical protein
MPPTTVQPTVMSTKGNGRPTQSSANQTSAASTTFATKPLIGLEYNRGDIANYSVITKTFSHQGVEYGYPQLIDMEDTDKQDKINFLISGYILNEINHEMSIGFRSDESSDSFVTQYRIALQTSELLSIVFEGRMEVAPAAPIQYASALTFDLHTLRTLRLNDFIYVDNDFAGKLLSSDRIFDPTGSNFEIALNEYFSEEEILRLFNESAYNHVFYITPRSTVIKMSILSREYFWVEIPLEDKGT